MQDYSCNRNAFRYYDSYRKNRCSGQTYQYDMYMPVYGTATGKAGPIKATVSAEGNSYICYVMDYDA